MKIGPNNHLTALIALCVSLACLFIPGFWGTLGVIVCLLVLGALALGLLQGVSEDNTKVAALPETGAETPLMRQASQVVTEALEGISGEVLGSRFRAAAWVESEKTVDKILDTCIRLLRAHLEAHTIAIFFPSSDGGYKIRRCDSSSPFINHDAVIYPGVGVIGAFLKDGLKQLNLQEIVTDSMTLYYYTRDAGIRSLMASPIVVEGAERGTIIADSTTVRHFTDSDHLYLSAIAELLGLAVFATYTSTDHNLQHLRLAATSSIEKDFFANLSLETIVDKLVNLVPFAIACDRLSISLRLGESRQAVVRSAWGAHTEGLQDVTFSLDDKTLIGLLYSKNIAFYRNFTAGHYELRYFAEEPRTSEFQSFLAFPLGVDQCRGALLLESRQRDAFTHSNRDLLLRLTTSAGLAMEKILILEKANALATHDGLTGLCNRRQYDAALHDEIRRTLRYNDPLSLVICD
ncbi:MAG: GAF domain-containing protein, partial [Chitinivibrionales bacterium]|nr:GAF domain-containing protein [Chitinivibrionales bacterium]